MFGIPLRDGVGRERFGDLPSARKIPKHQQIVAQVPSTLGGLAALKALVPWWCGDEGLTALVYFQARSKDSVQLLSLE